MNSEAIPTPVPDTRGADRPYWQSAHFWLYVLVFVAGFFLRWADLDAKAVHHDESLHLMYGRYFFDWPDVHYYRYDPMLHGPLLYNTLRLFYNTLGSTTWAGRAYVALLGTLLMFSPLLFRRYFTKNALLALCSAVALSPTLIYWSRFIREDNLQLTAMLITLAGVCLVSDRLKVIVAFLGLTLQFCIKENSFVNVALLTGFMLFELACNAVFHKRFDGLLPALGRYLAKYWRETLFAFGLGALVYCYFYTGHFRYWDGPLDGLYRKSLGYWIHQHNIERIAGPFLFHFYSLSWYESIFVLAVLVQVVLFYARADYGIKVAGTLMLLISAMLFVRGVGRNIQPELGQFPWSYFRLKDIRDLVALPILLIHPVLVTVQHLYRRQQALAFWGYLFTASFFTYSFLGEKVPWLSVYPFTAGLIYLVLYYQEYFQSDGVEWAKACQWSRIFSLIGVTCCLLGLWFVNAEGAFKVSEYNNYYWLGAGVAFILLSFCEVLLRLFGAVDLRVLTFVVFFIFNVRAAGLTNFVFAGEASEFISQVHTTPEFHNFALKLREEITNSLRGSPPRVLAMEDAVWPMTWYMRDLGERFKFDAPESERGGFDFIIKNWKEGEAPPPGFRAVRMNLRGWWVPDYDKMSLKKFLGYALSHRPWSDTGFSYVWLLVKERPGIGINYSPAS